MMMRRTIPIAVLSILGLASGAWAQTRHDTNAPIDFGAQHIELQDKANRAILSGDVSIKQAEMTLNAARMTVHYTGKIIGGSPQVSKLDASGNVVIRRPDQTARSQYAVYDLNSRVVTLLGNVTLNQGGNVVNGGRVNIDLDTGRATIDGSGVGSSRDTPGNVTRSNGRVTGRFSVPDRK